MTSYLLPYISDILPYIFNFFDGFFSKMFWDVFFQLFFKTFFDFFDFFRKEKMAKGWQKKPPKKGKNTKKMAKWKFPLKIYSYWDLIAFNCC